MHLQTLDYENIPFRYHRCHEYGHPGIDCPLVTHSRENRKKKDNNSISGGEGDIFAPSSPPISLVGLDLPSVEGSVAKVEPQGDLQIATRERMVKEPFIVGGLGTLFSLPSSLHLFTRHLNVSVIDWVEGLKKLSLNSIELQPPISAAIIGNSPSGVVIKPAPPE